MKRVLGSILFVIYSIIAITVTVLLLSYNDYNCSEIGGYTVYIVKDDMLEPDYKEGSILIIKHSSDRNIKPGDEVFLYKVINSQEFEFVKRKIDNKAQSGRHITYSVNNPEVPSGVENYASDYCVGKVENTVVIEGWGTLLSILESKWGYLFCIVVVSLLLFLQEVFDLVVEIKYGSKAANKKATGKASNGTKKATATKTTGTAKPRTSGTGAAKPRPKTTTATKTAKPAEVQTEENDNAKTE